MEQKTKEEFAHLWFELIKTQMTLDAYMKEDLNLLQSRGEQAFQRVKKRFPDVNMELI